MKGGGSVLTRRGNRPGVPATVAIPAGRLGSAPVGPFGLGRTPVTNEQYADFLRTRGPAPPPWWMDPAFSAALQPVVGVSWHDAAAYCAWLSEETGALWRLPSEAEWEFAACGGLLSPRTAWGDAVPPGEVPAGPLDGPWEVGRGTPNGYGLCDMGTIVHEWCLDWAERVVARAGSSPTRRRASRGGSWRHAIRWSSPSARSSLPPDFRYSDYGFRALCERDGFRALCES